MNRHIYNTCSEKAKNAFQAFCNNINNSTADIFIVMAQKAVCLYKILANQGLVQEKNVYSSVALDFCKYDFSGKHVAIVEDIIVSGSAVSNLAAKLINAGVTEGNIEIIALACDADYQTMKFTNRVTGENILKCGIRISDVECIELSYEISRILAYYGIPYDADYPAFDEIKIDETRRKKIEASPLWETYDITNDMQQEGGVAVFSIFPTNLMKEKVWKKLGANLNSLIHLKLRIYLSSADALSTMQVVPMALFNELSLQNTNALFAWFVENVFSTTEITDDWNDHARFRFMQYYIAHVLMSVFAEEIKIDYTINKTVFLLQYGLSVPDKIQRIIFSSPKKNVEYTPPFQNIEPDLLSNSIPTIDAEHSNSYCINDLLISPFVSHHCNDEMQARKALRHPVKHFIEDAQKIKELSQRLRRGLSLEALKKLISPFNTLYNVERMASLFIDRAIDYGVIVPIFYYNEERSYFCRAYRHGEDLPFGKADQARLLYYLKCLDEFLSQYSQEGESIHRIATVSFEKMIVLFYQIGVQKYKMFNRFLGFNNYPLLRERFCIHGALATITSQEKTHIYAEDNESSFGEYERWISNWLKKCNIIVPTVDFKRYHYHIDQDKLSQHLPEHELNNISEEIKINIEEIAQIVARWYALSYRRKNEFKADITALTSCSDPYVFLSAIVTEIHYFYVYWKNQGKTAITTIITTGESASFKYSKIPRIIQSGKEKAKVFEEHTVNCIKEKVAKLLKNNGEIGYYAWRRLWANPVEAPYPREIEEKIAEALSFFYFYAICYKWLILGGLEQEVSFSELWEDREILEYKQQFLKQVEKTPNFDKNILSTFELAEREQNIVDRTKLIERQIDRTVICSEELIEEVEKTVYHNTGTYSILYESCLIIDIKCPCKNDSVQVLLDLWDNTEENLEKTKFNIIQFGKNGEYYRFGLFYIKPLYIDPHNNNWREVDKNYLLCRYLKLREIAISKGYLTRAIYIPRIPAKLKFSHDLKAHITQYATDFSKKLIGKLSVHFKVQSLHQLLIFQTQEYGEDSCIIPAEICFNTIERLPDINISGITEKLVGLRLFNSNSFPCYNTSVISKSVYSTVLLVDKDNKGIGSGVLFSHNSKIYCITCAHVVMNCSEIAAFLPGRHTPVKLELLYCPNINSVNEMKAEEDVALLSPCWGIDNQADITLVFRKEDCITNTEDFMTKQFKCFGFPNDEGDYITDIALLGMNRQQMYMMRVNGNHHFKEGFSGAAIIDKQEERFLGIHRSHDNSGNAFCIPANVIIQTLESIQDK